jgi:acyl-CoA dehydrogenase
MSLLALSPTASILKDKLEKFVNERCIPAEIEYEDHIDQYSGVDRWKLAAIPPVMDQLKVEAQALGLWNVFLPHPIPDHLLAEDGSSSSSTNVGAGASAAVPMVPSMYLSNREYGILCEVMGRSFLAPEACNCSAPDTGNMEVLLNHGTKDQQMKYLKPLLQGNIRSAFLMTEPDIASSDARNLQSRLTKIVEEDGRVRYVLNGKKWWSTGAMDPRCGVALVVAEMDYSHPSSSKVGNLSKRRGGNQTVVIVPMSHPGIKCIRPLTVFGYDDAPHGHAEVMLENVELDESAVILGEGRGFEISQSRLGPGRIHHCMRAVGLASRCYELMLERTFQRQTFGRYLHEHGSCRELIADSASDIEAARLLTLSCAEDIDRHGAQKARDKIALIKVTVPELTSRVVDRAVQIYGGAGVSGDFPLARALVGLRTLRIADGPDAVHKQSLALMEIKKAKKRMLSRL